MKRLRGVLEKRIENTDDKGRIAEPPEVVAAKSVTKPGGEAKPPRQCDDDSPQ